MDLSETTEAKIQLVAAGERVSILMHFRAGIDLCSELSLHRVQGTKRHIEGLGRVPAPKNPTVQWQEYNEDSDCQVMSEKGSGGVGVVEG